MREFFLFCNFIFIADLRSTYYGSDKQTWPVTPKKEIQHNQKKKEVLPLSNTNIRPLLCKKRGSNSFKPKKEVLLLSHKKEGRPLVNKYSSSLEQKRFQLLLCRNIQPLSHKIEEQPLTHKHSISRAKKKEVQSLMHKCPYPKNELQPLSHANVQPLLHKNEDEPLAKTFNLSCTKKRFGLSRTQMFLSSDTQTFKLSQECPISHTNTQLLSCTNI